MRLVLGVVVVRKLEPATVAVPLRGTGSPHDGTCLLSFPRLANPPSASCQQSLMWSKLAKQKASLQRDMSLET